MAEFDGVIRPAMDLALAQPFNDLGLSDDPNALVEDVAFRAWLQVRGMPRTIREARQLMSFAVFLTVECYRQMGLTVLPEPPEEN